MRVFFYLLMLCLAGACSPAGSGGAQVIAVGALKVDGAYAKQPVPGTEKSVGYMRLTNLGESALRLTAVSMTGVRTVELHTTRNDDGVMRMRRLDGVDIGPGETVALEPGGHHLMLFGVGALPDPAVATLTLEPGGTHEVTFDVRDFRDTRETR